MLPPEKFNYSLDKKTEKEKNLQLLLYGEGKSACQKGRGQLYPTTTNHRNENHSKN